MAIDSIPTAVFEELIDGLSPAVGLADVLCSTREVDTREGTMPVERSVDSVPRSQGRQGLAPGVEPKQNDTELTSVSYSCLRYPGQEELPDQDRLTFDNVTGVSSIQRLMKNARKVGIIKRDLDCISTMQDTSLNDTFDVTSDGVGQAAWDDGGTSSTPYSDIEDGLDLAPDSDTIFVGRQVVKDLKRHPDTYAQTSNFDAGHAGDGELANLLMNKFTLENVVLGNKYFYNTAAEGQSLTIGHLGDTDVWLGHRSDFIMARLMGLEDFEQERSATRRALCITYETNVDFLRPHTEMGVYFQNVT